MRSRQKGFSLIELLIVVAIILIIAAIAIPNLLRSKMAANEASAVGSLRTINTAAVEYSTTYGGYPATLVNLGGASTAAAFLREFVADTPWIHLDIAGTAWMEENKPWIAKGPSGIAVRSLVEWVKSYENSK